MDLRRIIIYSSLHIIYNVLCDTDPYVEYSYTRWSKINDERWLPAYDFENIQSLNDSNLEELIEAPYEFALQISKSSIPSLPPNGFAKYPKMRSVFLSDLNISLIHSGAFDGLDYLKEIDLSKNKLTQFKEGVFDRLENLTYLDLSNNYLTNLSNRSFVGLDKLKYLYLQGNQITFMDSDVFESQVNSLIELDISSNRFKTINTTFTSLSRLTHLFLQNNTILDLMPDLFKNLTSLRFLDISCISMKHINVSDNKISILGPDFFDSRKNSLKILNISSNSLQHINVIFHGMKQLTHLYLQANIISGLGSDSFQNLSSLEHLDLSNNYIGHLPSRVFSGSEQITRLYLNNNKIMFLSVNAFESQRHSLGILSLSSNALRDIDKEFRGLGHLTELHLRENQISSTAADSFQGLTSLGKLDISSNNLERFQYGLLDHLENIMYLNFSYNKFTEFPLDYLSYLINLNTLIFDNNKMESLNESQILHHFPHLEKISLSGNFNWSCTRLVKFVKELRLQKIEVISGNYFTGDNVRGMACYEDASIPNQKDDKCDKQDADIDAKQSINCKSYKTNSEVNLKYTDKNIEDIVNVLLEKHYNGNVFITILLIIITVTLIVMTFLQVFFNIKAKRNTSEEHLELI